MNPISSEEPSPEKQTITPVEQEPIPSQQDLSRN